MPVTRNNALSSTDLRAGALSDPGRVQGYILATIRKPRLAGVVGRRVSILLGAPDCPIEGWEFLALQAPGSRDVLHLLAFSNPSPAAQRFLARHALDLDLVFATGMKITEYWARWTLANKFGQQDSFDAARIALLIDPGDIHATSSAINSLVAINWWEPVRPFTQRRVVLQPGSARAWFDVGRCETELNPRKTILRISQRTLVLEPTNPLYLELRCRMMIRREDFAGAQSLISRFAVACPENEGFIELRDEFGWLGQQMRRYHADTSNLEAAYWHCLSAGRLQIRSYRERFLTHVIYHSRRYFHYNIRALRLPITPDHVALGDRGNRANAISPNPPRTIDLKPTPGQPSIETGEAIRRGCEGVVVEGNLRGGSAPTQYWLEYQIDGEVAPQSTVKRWAPPPLSRRRKIRLVEEYRQWGYYTQSLHYAVIAAPTGDKAEQTATGFARMRAPFCIDMNHMTGAGTFFLIGAWSPAADIPTGAGVGPTPLDYRDARVEIDVANELDADAKSFITLGVQAKTENSPSDEFPQSAGWMLSGQSVEVRSLPYGAQKTLQFELRPQSAGWTMMGNNPALKDDADERYAYSPLDRVLRSTDENIFFCLSNPDEPDLPVGHLSFGTMRIQHRDWSILSPTQGTVLLEQPEGAPVDAMVLTDGGSGDPAEYWVSPSRPTRPQRFVWDLGSEQTLDRVLIHQNPEWPCRTIEILTSCDGNHFEPCTRLALSQGRPEFGELRQTMTQIPEAPPVRFVAAVLLDGYERTRFGLDAIELFARDPQPVPDNAPASIAFEIPAPPPGATLSYQLVAENEYGRCDGETRTLEIPVEIGPEILSVEECARGDDRITLAVRLATGGRPCRLGIAGVDLEITPEAEIEVGHDPMPKLRLLRVPSEAGAYPDTVNIQLTDDEGRQATRKFSL